MELAIIKTDEVNLIVECTLCGKSIDSTVGNPVRDILNHIIAEHHQMFTSSLIYSLLRNTQGGDMNG